MEGDVSCECVSSMNRVSLNLCKKLSEKDENVFLSGYSISVALTMLIMGCNNHSYNELKDFMGWTKEENEMISSCKTICERLTSTRGIQLYSGNSVWAQELRNDYIQRVQSDLGATAFPLKSEKEINSWTSQKTQGLIDEIVKELPSPCLGVLVNAIYFKGTWFNSFPVRSTMPGEFFLLNNSTIHVPTMRITENFKSCISSSHGMTIVELPYEGKKYSMVLVLPSPDQTWHEFKNIPNNELLSLFNQLQIQKLTVTLPKFKIDSDIIDLKSTLEDHFNITTIFDYKKADLSRLSNNPLIEVSNIYHRAVCNVNETGTEAAAATAVVMAPGGGIPAPIPTINFNRPFFYAIRNIPSNLLLFCGYLMEPKQ